MSRKKFKKKIEKKRKEKKRGYLRIYVAVEYCSLLTFPKGLALLVNSSYALTVLHSYLHRKIGHVSLEKKAIEKQMVECFKKIKDFLFFKVFTQLNSSPLSLKA